MSSWSFWCRLGFLHLGIVTLPVLLWWARMALTLHSLMFVYIAMSLGERAAPRQIAIYWMSSEMGFPWGMLMVGWLVGHSSLNVDHLHKLIRRDWFQVSFWLFSPFMLRLSHRYLLSTLHEHLGATTMPPEKPLGIHTELNPDLADLSEEMITLQGGQ